MIWGADLLGLGIEVEIAPLGVPEALTERAFIHVQLLRYLRPSERILY